MQQNVATKTQKRHSSMESVGEQMGTGKKRNRRNTRLSASQITSLRVIPTVTSYYHIFVPISDILCAKLWKDEEERITLMNSIILSSSSLLLVGGPAVTTVIYLANLITANLQAPRRLATASTAKLIKRWLRQSRPCAWTTASTKLI